MITQPCKQKHLLYFLLVAAGLSLAWLEFSLYLLPHKYIKPRVSCTEYTKHGEVKNVLMWTSPKTDPFSFLGHGRKPFTDAGCRFNNCYITNRRDYLKTEADFEAVLFHAPEYTWRRNTWKHGEPKKRDQRQKYVFVSVESAANYPSCASRWNGYFNWTMTYRLDSDIPWNYVTVRNARGEQAGPSEAMRWQEPAQNVSADVLLKLGKKTKAVAWFVSNCLTLGKREQYAKLLESELRKLGLQLDMYGKCGALRCKGDACLKMLEDDYHFYLAFENSLSEDYVTEKLLSATEHLTVPVVWGGANYSRFLPPDSYLDARELSPEALAASIKALMGDAEAYAAKFRWRSLYAQASVYSSAATHPLCRLCAALNDRELFSRSSVRADFNAWWNGQFTRC